MLQATYLFSIPGMFQKMATVIDALRSVLLSSGATGVDAVNNELVATLRLTNGRTQTAKVTITRGQHGVYHVARCVSRACIADNPQIVRHALRINSKYSCCGCVLVTSLKPPVIDVTANVIICPNGDFLEEIISSLFQVVELADRVEANVMKQDFF